MLDKKYYLEMDVFMEALQDEGEVDPRSGDRQLIHHPKIKSLANKIFNKLKTNKSPDIPANMTRVSPFIVEIINFKRKKVGVSSVHETLQKYSADGTELFIVHNNLLFYGYNIILSEIHFSLWKSKKKKSKERSPADAIRLAAIMLHPDHQKAVSMMLSGSRVARAQSDQAVDCNLAWAMDAVTQCKDVDFEVDMPHEIDPDDVNGVDPNDIDPDETVAGMPNGSLIHGRSISKRNTRMPFESGILKLVVVVMIHRNSVTFVARIDG
jgi:hypothetical protein